MFTYDVNIYLLDDNNNKSPKISIDTQQISLIGNKTRTAELRNIFLTNIQYRYEEAWMK
jgi:hypothetical protein